MDNIVSFSFDFCSAWSIGDSTSFFTFLSSGSSSEQYEEKDLPELQIKLKKLQGKFLLSQNS